MDGMITFRRGFDTAVPEWRLAMVNHLGVYPALLLVLLSPVSAPASEWEFLERDAGGVPVYYDPGSVKSIPGESVTVSIKSSYSELKSPPEGKEGLSHCRKLVEINCLQKTFLVIESALYDLEGKLSSSSCPFPSRRADVGSTRVMRELYDRVCPNEPVRTMPGWR